MILLYLLGIITGVFICVAARALKQALDAIRPETNFEPQAEEEDSDR